MKTLHAKLLSLFTALLLVAGVSLASAADIAVVQQAVNVGTGNQDFISSATFGGTTPKAALLIMTAGVTNGTFANHAVMGIGATDGTNQNNVSVSSQDGQTTTNTHSWSGVNNCIGLENPTSAGGAILWRATCTLIADGVRINIVVTDGVQYQLTVILFGGTGVSNAHVNKTTTSGSVDGTVVVTAPGFQPDFLITWGRALRPFDNDPVYNTNNLQFGIVQRLTSNPHDYDAFGFEDAHGVGTTDIRSIMSNSSAYATTNLQPYVLIQDFSSSGFTTVTKGSANAVTFGYLAVKLSGLTAKVLQFDSPISGGSQQITGIGMTPQFGLTIMNAHTIYGTQSLDDNGEVFGIGAFTAAAQTSNMFTSDDGVTTTNAESLTHSRPVFLRKDGATFMDATFTSFGSGTATFNYGTANGTARKWAGLFIQEPQATSRSMMLLGVGP